MAQLQLSLYSGNSEFDFQNTQIFRVIAVKVNWLKFLATSGPSKTSSGDWLLLEGNGWRIFVMQKLMASSNLAIFRPNSLQQLHCLKNFLYKLKILFEHRFIIK